MPSSARYPVSQLTAACCREEMPAAALQQSFPMVIESKPGPYRYSYILLLLSLRSVRADSKSTDIYIPGMYYLVYNTVVPGTAVCTNSAISVA